MINQSSRHYYLASSYKYNLIWNNRYLTYFEQWVQWLSEDVLTSYVCGFCKCIFRLLKQSNTSSHMSQSYVFSLCFSSVWFISWLIWWNLLLQSLHWYGYLYVCLLMWVFRVLLSVHALPHISLFTCADVCLQETGSFIHFLTSHT